MPIQWNGKLLTPEQLAAVIQGEAADPAGQFAVAATMYNRLQSGKFGNSIQDIVTPTQFNGYNPKTSPTAVQLANAIWRGDPPPGGSTGNSLYFSAKDSPGYATGSEKQITPGGANIGGNLFSDQFGSPSADFVPPHRVGTPTPYLNPTPSAPSGTSIASIPGFLQSIGATGENAPPKKTTLGALGDVAKTFEGDKSQGGVGQEQPPPQFLNMPPPGTRNASTLLNAGAAPQIQQALGYAPTPAYGTGITSMAQPIAGPQSQSLQQLMQMYQQQLGPALYYGYGLDGYGGGYG